MSVRIEYTTASDGVRIAFARSGRGPLLVSMPPLPFRHVALEWELPEDRRWLERLARACTVVQYDPRGLGLSQRGITSYSLDALLLDVDALLERVAPKGAALFACVN